VAAWVELSYVLFIFIQKYNFVSGISCMSSEPEKSWLISPTALLATKVCHLLHTSLAQAEFRWEKK